MPLMFMLDGEPFRMGRIVHFIDASGKQHPMLLTSVHKSGINNEHHASGVVFDYLDQPCVAQLNIPYDPSKKTLTWHWPSRVERKKKKPELGKPIFDLKKTKKTATK